MWKGGHSAKGRLRTEVLSLTGDWALCGLRAETGAAAAWLGAAPGDADVELHPLHPEAGRRGKVCAKTDGKELVQVPKIEQK